MRKLAFICVPLLLLTGQSAFAHGWQAAAMWNWTLTTANPKFDELDATDAAHQEQIDAQQAEIDSLTTQLAAIDATYLQQLQAYVEVDELTNPSQPVVRVVAANLQIVNGGGNTESINGTGNLIVGYNEAWGTTVACTDGYYNQDQATCEAEGLVWAANHRSGSHNLVVGTGHSYSRFGGFVAGQYSVINGEYVSVSGGDSHTASAQWSSVSGGYHNIASENNASVSGGEENTAAAYAASISGGNLNVASGGYSSISGGSENTATTTYSSVSGGNLNVASGKWSSVSGGGGNAAAGGTSSISGGQNNATGFFYSSVSGGQGNFADSSWASISGGKDRSLIGLFDWAAGALYQDQ
jgi:hypothetical protein